MMNDTQSRVRAIAQIHENLYSSADLAQIEFGHYTQTLTRDLFAFYNISPDRIRLRLNTQDVVLDITQAIPLGLILNELVVNCLKDAFSDGRSGTVEVSLHYLNESIDFNQSLDEGMGQLCVKDSGIGMPGRSISSKQNQWVCIWCASSQDSCMEPRNSNTTAGPAAQ